VLREVPGSRLLFLRSSHQPAVAELLRGRFAERGIDPSRILVRQPPRGDVVYLSGYAEIDVLLDTFPFGGHTMTCEALWMGVPVLTLRGDRPCGRLSASVLTSCGLSELIAATPDEYVGLARLLAADIEGLADLRTELRDRVRRGLGDAPAFTARLEDVYRRMWRDWCRRQRAEAGPSALTGLLHPGQGSEPEQQAADAGRALMEEARAHLEARRFAEAERAYRTVLAGDADNAAAWHGLGRIAWAAGRTTAAVECLNRALTLRPDDPPVRDDLERLRRGGPLFASAPRSEGMTLQEAGAPSAPGSRPGSSEVSPLKG
jgi:hypothetical protein